MDIPVSSTLGFIGIVFLGFGLFLILAGLEIFTIQQVSVKKGRKTWGLGIGIVILGIAFLVPEISTQISSPDPAAQQGLRKSSKNQQALQQTPQHLHQR